MPARNSHATNITNPSQVRRSARHITKRRGVESKLHFGFPQQTQKEKAADVSGHGRIQSAAVTNSQMI